MARGRASLQRQLWPRTVVPNHWERLDAPFVGNVEEQPAGLAMNRVGVVTLQPTGGARIADLVGPHECLQSS